MTDSPGVSPDSMCRIPRAEKSNVFYYVDYNLYCRICHELYHMHEKYKNRLSFRRKTDDFGAAFDFDTISEGVQISSQEGCKLNESYF